jgi:hypothetical protein
LICVSTNKLRHIKDIFIGENNSNGSDIVRQLKVSGNEIDKDKMLYEMIIIEYDTMLIVNNIGEYQLIN